MEVGNLMIDEEMFSTNYVGQWVEMTTEDEIIYYIDSKINGYLNDIEKNKKYLAEHPRSGKSYMLQDLAILKAKIETLREVKNYVKVLMEE